MGGLKEGKERAGEEDTGRKGKKGRRTAGEEERRKKSKRRRKRREETRGVDGFIGEFY